MILLKAIFLALADVLKIWSNVFSLAMDIFWCLVGIIGLVLSVVLFPVLVMRKVALLNKNVGKRTTKINKRLVA